MSVIEREFVFLSYANEDVTQVHRVYEGLKERKVNVWFDKEDMKIGRWKSQVLKAISRSKYFVICLSNAALKKTGGEKPGFQDEELQFAYEIAINQPDDKFSIVPIRLEECSRGDHRISIFQQYDLFENWEKGLDKLAVNLGGDSFADSTAKDERTEDEIIIAKLMGKGATFFYRGEYDKALSRFDAAININPYDQFAWYNKGATLAALDRNEEALDAYEKAIEINPDDQSTWYNKGAILAALNRPKDALKAYDKAIEINPNDRSIQYQLACAYSLNIKRGKALDFLIKDLESFINKK